MDTKVHSATYASPIERSDTMAGLPYYLKKKREKENRKFCELWVTEKQVPKVTCVFSGAAALQPTRPSIRIVQAFIGRAEAEVPTCRALDSDPQLRESGIIDLKSRICTTTRLVPDSPSAASPHTP